jgi:hypothetical protein
MSTLRLSNGLTGLHRRPYILDAIVLTDNSQSPTDQRPQSRKLPHKEGIAATLSEGGVRTRATSRDSRRGTIVRIDGNLPASMRGFEDAHNDERIKRPAHILARLLTDPRVDWHTISVANANLEASLDRLPARQRSLIRPVYLTTAVQLHVVEGWLKPQS